MRAGKHQSENTVLGMLLLKQSKHGNTFEILELGIRIKMKSEYQGESKLLSRLEPTFARRGTMEPWRPVTNCWASSFNSSGLLPGFTIKSTWALNLWIKIQVSHCKERGLNFNNHPGHYEQSSQQDLALLERVGRDGKGNVERGRVPRVIFYLFNRVVATFNFNHLTYPFSFGRYLSGILLNALLSWQYDYKSISFPIFVLSYPSLGLSLSIRKSCTSDLYSTEKWWSFHRRHFVIV